MTAHKEAVLRAVLTERLDWLVQTGGTRLGPGRVVSVTEFRDGRIAVWRELFDASGFLGR